MEQEKKALAAKLIERVRVILSDLPESPEIRSIEVNDHGSFTGTVLGIKFGGALLRIYLQEDKERS